MLLTLILVIDRSRFLSKVVNDSNLSRLRAFCGMEVWGYMESYFRKPWLGCENLYFVVKNVEEHFRLLHVSNYYIYFHVKKL